MARTYSTMLPLGTSAPDFTLPDTDGSMVGLEAIFKGREIVTVWFLCNHCPYVKHVRHELAAIGREYQERGVGVVAISSNDAVAYPEDGPDLMAVEKREVGYTFPYLYDETQEVALAYQAACTPDFYVFDRSKALVYRGQLDASRPGNGLAVTGADLRLALDAAIEGRPAVAAQRPSMGCNIKWKPGFSPDYRGEIG